MCQLSQADQAELVAAAEQSVQRAMAVLKRSGAVRSGYRRVVICDPVLLGHAAGTGST